MSNHIKINLRLDRKLYTKIRGAALTKELPNSMNREIVERLIRSLNDEKDCRKQEHEIKLARMAATGL